MNRHALESIVGGPDSSFDDVVLPHLDAAYRLARWLTRNKHDAEDAVQEASLRALRYFRTFSGGNGRAWFLTIVRNICSGRRGWRVDAVTDPFDEEQHHPAQPPSDPETLLLRTNDATAIARALRNLPERYHHLLVLRGVEGLSYRELADQMHIPLGTVMSRLSRARNALRAALDVVEYAGAVGASSSGDECPAGCMTPSKSAGPVHSAEKAAEMPSQPDEHHCKRLDWQPVTRQE
jgi:RNA polymerase sigma-70 factor (ECF subfamily)